MKCKYKNFKTNDMLFFLCGIRLNRQKNRNMNI